MKTKMNGKSEKAMKSIFDMAVSSGEKIGGEVEKKKVVRKLFDW